MDYDVIVAGAGIGGAAAAYYLGEAGYRVLVLEKERLPRYKPCGGGVPGSVFGYFPFPRRILPYLIRPLERRTTDWQD